MADIGTILLQLENAGIFDFLLPFLLVFALVFGILTTTNILGTNKGVHSIIAIVIALMALRLGFMQAFFTQIFPRLGIGLAILLSILILVGLFIPSDEMRYWGWGLGAIGFIIAIVIVTQSFQDLGYIGYSAQWESYVGYIIGAVLLIGVIVAVATSGGPASTAPSKPATYAPFRNS